MAETRISILVKEEDKNRWKQAAEDSGVTFTEFVKESVELRAGLDDESFDKIKALAKALRTDPALVMQNLAIGWMARRDAYKEVWGVPRDELMEFIATEDGPIVGQELYDLIKADELQTQKPLREQGLKQLEAKEGKWQKTQ